ncbi:MAG: ATP-binding protein [Chitinophagaceae bacterium]|nr:ATP-binding protein [Chitinophagaceae bacterium]
MEIKSNKVLRHSIKTIDGADNTPNTDSDFIGDLYKDGKAIKKGFFSVYHGIKPNIAGYLHGLLKIAEDGQAIYEFIQNAVDCNSRHFWIYYNDDYFLAINNGEPFERNDIASILNIGQSEKQNLIEKERCDKIGRFGIGFKLVHRLVGENDGSSELTKIINGEIKGPVLFSWSRYSQLERVLSYKSADKIRATFIFS